MAARKKRHEEHEEHVNHERWLITYADMITLLMVLFIVLFAIGQTDLAKFAQLRDSLNNSIGGKGGNVVFDGGAGPFNGSMNVAPKEQLGIQEVAAAADKQIKREAAMQQESQNFGEIEKQIHAQLTASGLGGTVQFHKEQRGLVVTVVSDRVLFDLGSAELRPEGAQVLNGLAPALVKLPNAVTIEGHTDDRPIRSAQYPTNWELSTARATSVLRYLTTKGMPARRLSAAGYADQQPIAPNDTEANRAQNRRVEVVILSTVDETLAAASPSEAKPEKAAAATAAAAAAAPVRSTPKEQ